MSRGASGKAAPKLGLLVALGWLSAASPAAADPPPVTAALDWHRSSAAEDCLDAGALASGVEKRLRRSVFAPRERADVVVGVRLTRRPESAWVAQIELRSTKGQLIGTRELVTSAEDCSALDESLTLAIALMVDVSADELPKPVEALQPVEAPPAKPVQRAAVSPSRRAPIELPRDTHAPRKPWRFNAVALGTVAVGLLPGVSPGVRAGLGVEPPAFWATDLSVSIWPAQSDSTAEEGARLTLVTVGLHVCPFRAGPKSRVFGLCFGQEVGQQSASGFGFDRNDERKRLVYDLSLRARLSQRVVGGLRLVAGVQGLLPLSRDRFIAGEADGTRREVFRRPVAAAAGELGVGVDFP
jgi:hypothetical protein